MIFQFITGDPRMAAYAVSCGVDRIFVDFEVQGKAERQGHLDTVMSRHRWEDLPALRAASPGGGLLARLNPLGMGTDDEVSRCVDAGVDVVMLPMFRRMDEADRFVDLVRGRMRVCFLVETPDALRIIGDLVRSHPSCEYYLGLNDLHLALGHRFMFQPLVEGMVDHFAERCRAGEADFGFGGIARVGQGDLPAEAVLGEHLRLGSSRVILSRSFHGRSPDVESLMRQMDLAAEIRALREVEVHLRTRDDQARESDRLATWATIRGLIAVREMRA